MNIFSQAIGAVRNIFGGNRQELDDATRTATAATALTFYDGANVPPQVPVKPGGVNHNIYVNLARTIVDKGVEFLFGEPLQLSVGTDDDKRAAEYLKKHWSQEQRDVDFDEQATDGGIIGDAYLKISINPDGSPRVTVGDPNLWRIETDPHDISCVTCFRCQYQIDEPSTGKPALFKEETTPREDGKAWLIRSYHSYDGGRTWSMTSDVTWNFAFPPVFHAKNLPNGKSPYGRPDLSPDVLTLIRHISRLDSLCSKIVDTHAAPKPYAKNLKKQDLQWGTDGMLFLNPSAGGAAAGAKSVEAEIGLLEMQNDISTALALRKVLREALAELSGVPEIASGKVENLGQLSGVALRILYGPLIAKTKRKRLRYGRMITECARALLTIGGFADQPIALQWGNPLPSDEKESVEIAEGKLRCGFSEDTVIAQLGGNPAEEREKSKLNASRLGSALLGAFDRGATDEADTSSSTARTPDVLAKLANAAGILIRSGFDPAAALRSVGLDPINHLGLLPVTLQDA